MCTLYDLIFCSSRIITVFNGGVKYFYFLILYSKHKAEKLKLKWKTENTGEITVHIQP